MLAPGAPIGRGRRGGARVGGVRRGPRRRGLVRGPGAAAAGGARAPGSVQRPAHRPGWVLGYAARGRRSSPAAARSRCWPGWPCSFRPSSDPRPRSARRARGRPGDAPPVAWSSRRLALALPCGCASGCCRSGSRRVTTRCTAGTRGRPGRSLRVLDEARTWLFPLYSSWLTPVWLRALGARIGKDVEASTVLLIPTLTTVDDGAFLADDTLLGGYELGGGWLRDRAGQDRQARLRRQLRDDRPGAQGAQAGAWSPCSPPRRGVPRPRRAPRGSAARRPSCGATAGDGDDSRTYNPPTRLRVARALGRGAAAWCR